MADLTLGLRIRVNNDGSASVLSGTARAIRDVGESAGRASQEADRMAQSLASIKRFAAGAFAGIGIASVTRDIIDVNRNMEMLRAQLTSLTGTAQGSAQAFAFINKFASDTPFQIGELTKAYINLGNFGIKPTAQVMSAITNQASKLGASSETLAGITTALGQAYAKGKLQSDEMQQLMERGVPVLQLLAQVTGKQTDELQDMAAKGLLTRDVIERLIEKMGEMASGANANAMQTLNGKISNLADSWQHFADVLLNDKSEGVLKSIVSGMTASINALSNIMDTSMDAQIRKAEARIARLSNLARMTGGLFGQGGIDYEQARINDLNRAILKDQAKGMADRYAEDLLTPKSKAASAEKENAYVIRSRIELLRVSGKLRESLELEASAIKGLVGEQAREYVSNELAIAQKREMADSVKQYASEQERARRQSEAQANAARQSAENAANDLRRQLENADDDLNKFAERLNNEMATAGMSERQRLYDEVGQLMRQRNAIDPNGDSDMAQAWLAEIHKLIDGYVELKDAQKIEQTEKAALEQQIDRYKQLTLSAREYFIEKLKGQGLTPEKIAPVAQQYDTNVAVEAAEKAHKALLDYSKQLDVVSDKSGRLSSLSSSIFDGALGGISAMTGAFTSLVDSLEESTRAMDELNKKQQENAAIQLDPNSKTFAEDARQQQENAMKFAAQEKNLHKDRVQRELSGARQIAGAAAKMFGEKTAAAKAFHNIEMAIGAAQMAMEAQKMVVYVAGIAPKLAAGASAMFAQSGWGGFAGVAAMAAVMAAMGYGMASVGDGGRGYRVPVSPDSGTVLGDASAKSNSIDNVGSLLKEIHAREFLELQGINHGVSAMQSGITSSITKLFQGGGLKAPANLGLGSELSSMAKIIKIGVSGPMDKVPVIGPILTGIKDMILGGLFGKTTRKITDSGFYAGKTSLGSILDGGQLAAQKFTEITKTTKSWFAKSVSVSELLAPLDREFKSSLTKMFAGMGQSMMALAQSFGADMSTAVNNYVIPKMKVSLFGLSSEQMTKRLTNVLSTQMDKMTKSIFGGLIASYQKLGEGLFETASRLAAEQAVVANAIKSTGGVFSGDTVAMADSLVQLAGGLKEFQSSFNDYYSKFYTETEQLANASKNLVEILSASGVNLPATRNGYRDLVNAQDLSTIAGRKLFNQLLDLSGAADKYYAAQENLRKTAEDNLRNLAGLAPTVGAAIANLNDKLIEARNNWAAAGLSLDTMTELTGKAFARLRESLLQPFVDAKTAIAEQLASVNGTPVESGNIADMLAALARMTDPSDQIIMVNKIQKAVKSRYDNEISLINKTTSALRGLSDFVAGLNTSELSPLSLQDQLREAAGSYGTTLLKAQAGNADALAALPNVARTYLEKAQAYYASSQEFASIYNDVSRNLSALVGSTSTAADEIKTATDAAGQVLTDSLTSLGSLLEGFVTQLGAQFDKTLSQTMAPPPVTVATATGINGNGATPTYNHLVENRNTHLDAFNTATANAALKGQSKQYVKDQKAIASAAATDLKAAQLKLDNYNYWHNLGDEKKAVQSAGDVGQYLHLKQLIAARNTRDSDKKRFKTMASAYLEENGGTLHFRAKGGMTSGATVINEDGPELLRFAQPTMVVNNKSTQNIIAAGNEAAVKGLHELNKNVMILIKLTQETGKISTEKLGDVADGVDQIRQKIRLGAAS